MISGTFSPDVCKSGTLGGMLPKTSEHLALRFYDVSSADGTRLRAWTNDAEGPTLLCNGLGTNPHAWPAVLRLDCDVRVISGYHRGVGGSEPSDPSRVGIDAFLEDAIAVMDDVGVKYCAVAGWSIGVNTAFELVVLHRSRVTRPRRHRAPPVSLRRITVPGLRCGAGTTCSPAPTTWSPRPNGSGAQANSSCPEATSSSSSTRPCARGAPDARRAGRADSESA